MTPWTIGTSESLRSAMDLLYDLCISNCYASSNHLTMMDSDDNENIEKPSPGSPVNVITAGGAGSAKKKKKKKKRNVFTQLYQKKATDAVASDDGAVSLGTSAVSTTTAFKDIEASSNEITTAATAAALPGGGNGGSSNDHHKFEVLTALEMEQSESATDQDDALGFARSPAPTQPGGPSTVTEASESSSGFKDIDISNDGDKPSANGAESQLPLMSEIDVVVEETSKTHDMIWLIFCFVGIMASFVCYGLLLEYTTSGGRKLHELSFLFVTSALYTITAAAGRYVRAETPTTIPPARFAILGLTSMGSTFCSVRSLRYVLCLKVSSLPRFLS